MGFLDAFRKKEEASYEINMDSLDSWFEDKFSSELKKTEQETEKIKDEIRKSLKATEEGLNKLEKASFEGGDKRYAAINMLKDSFVKSSKQSLSKLDNNFDMLKEVISEVNEITPKQGISLSMYFKNYMPQITSSVKKAEEHSKKLDESISSVKDEIRKFLDKSNQIFLGISESKDLIESKQEEIQNLREGVEELRKEKESILKGQDAKNLEENKKELREIEKEINVLNFSIQEMLSPLERPLKKLAHKTGYEDINKLEEEYRKLDLKENEIKKLEEFFSNKQTLPKKRGEKEALEERRKNIISLIESSSLDSKIKETESNIGVKEKGIEDIRKEIESMKRKIEDDKNQLEISRKNIENYLSKKLNIKLTLKSTKQY